MRLATPETWWVTGAGSGIGHALTIRLAQTGHRVYASSRQSAALQALARQFPNVVALPVDVRDRNAMRTLFSSLAQPPVRLDGVILSAGICDYTDLPDLGVDAITNQMQTNFLGVVHACEAALPLLDAASKQLRPQLIGIGSLSSWTGFPRAEGYGASKAAMAYFLDSLRCDVQQRIQVTLVYPGFVTTRLTAANNFPMPFEWPLDRAADYVFARLWQQRRYITFPWQLRWLLRIARLLPGLWYNSVVPGLARQQLQEDNA